MTIIGGGVSALMLAAHLDKSKFSVVIYERNAALGRKFLVAGDGGLNLTHSEEMDQFVLKYKPHTFLQNSFATFNNTDFRDWLRSIGVETFVGSSKRVFPVKEFKPIDVLNALITVVKKNDVEINLKQEWCGWDANGLIINNLAKKEENIIRQDIVVFALGGGSWSVTGSNGKWLNCFSSKKIKCLPLQASNCAVEVKWESTFLKVAEGKFLKNISVKINEDEKNGELVITKFGLEGGVIYALNGFIRAQLNRNGIAEIALDFKPRLSVSEIVRGISNRGNKSLSSYLEQQLGLSETQLNLLKHYLNKHEFTNSAFLAQRIKNFPIQITSLAPIDEAISTVGGISLDEVDANFQLKKMPNHYVIGEMLDWDAPTGGYLLQACFSMGYFLAKALNENN